MIKFENNVLRLRTDGFEVEPWNLSIEVNGDLLHVSEAQVQVEQISPLVICYTFARPKIVWRIRVTGSDAEPVIDSTVINNGDQPVKLGKASLMDSSSVRLGSREEDIVVLPWPVWGMTHVYRLSDPELPGLSKVKIQFFNHTRGQAVQIAFLTFQRANTHVEYQIDGTHGLKDVNVSCDFAGWELAAHSETSTETLTIRVGTDPYQQMEDWADEVGRRCRAKIWDETPIGYLGWSWTDCTNGERNYEDITLEVLDAINQRLGGLGVRYLWTSMDNIEGSLPGNWLKWNTRCIPSGREAFIKKVEEKGFLQGLWIGPFYLCSMLTDLMEHFEGAMLKNPDGSLMVVCTEWDLGDAGLLAKKDRPCLYALDPSHPKVLAYIREVFETYHRWGVRYYMVDFLEAGAGNIHRFPYTGHYNQSLVAGPEAYTHFLRAMKSAAGEDAYLLSSSGPSLHHAGILDGVRTGNDFGEGRALSPDTVFYPATSVINHLAYWTGPQYALINQAAYYHTHRKLFLNDSGNVLTVDKPIPLPHARIAATLHAFSGGPTMLGDDIRTIDDERLSLIKKTLPRSRDVGRPIDLFDSPKPTGPRVFLRHVEKSWGNFDVLAIYNLEKKPLAMSLDLKRMKLDPAKEYLVWDFWNEAFVGKTEGSLEVFVSPESVTVLRLTENVGHVTLLGTDMHMMMGEMEIPECSYDTGSMVCRLKANRPSDQRGMVFLYAPDNIYIKNFDGLHIAKDGRDDSLVIGVPLVFDTHGFAEREIRFGNVQEVVNTSRRDEA